MDEAIAISIVLLLYGIILTPAVLIVDYLFGDKLTRWLKK